MAILNNSNAISTAGGYDINNSLRIRDSASAYLNRTFGSGGSQTTWTWSAWVKKGLLGGTYRGIFGITNGSNDSTWLALVSNNDSISFQGWNTVYRTTTQVFRDPSAWYHIVVAVDTTQATAANRIRFYVNGSEITAFQTNNNPTQNATLIINSATTHNIGRDTQQSSNFDGYMAEVNFVNNQQLTPSSFGETDTTTGSWKPKAYTGTYGTNGFYLKFSDIATTSGSNAGLGKDFSGNTNYWTTNNISVTAGTTYDAMIDSPTLTSATVANYPTLNPINKASTSTISNANLGGNSNGSTWNGVVATIEIPSTGKYYWEVTASGANTNCGIISNTSTNFSTALATYPANGFYSYTYYASNGYKIAGPSNTQTAYGATYTNGDVIGIALDMDAGTLTFYKNNTSQGTAFTSLTDKYLPYLGVYDSGVQAINFGQRPFSYTPPTGFVALNTYNLPDSTIKKGNTVMDAVLWTGDGTSSKTVSSYNFAPDFLWGKNRTTASIGWWVYDTTRGAGNNKELATHNTLAEGDDNEDVYGYLSAFTSNGFTGVNGTGSPNYYFNQSSATYVAYGLKANGGTTSSNTQGSITSTVQANTTAGFSVVTYTGNGSSSATVGHGLGVAPKMIIIKSRSATTSWLVMHTSLSTNNNIALESTGAQFACSATLNGGTSTSPTSSLFSFVSGSTNVANVNASAGTFVAYCWAEIAGFSKFGYYTGNGNADGAFVYLGFRPKFVMIKASSSAGYNWYIWDTSRNTYNVLGEELSPNLSDAAATQTDLDILSNGFKLRTSASRANGSGITYIYAAYAENPFKNSNAF